MGRLLELLVSWLALALLITKAVSTNIATFTDDNCQDSLQNNNGPNGYPDGTCTRLDRIARFRSFQVVNIDPGCGVTIYHADESNLACSDSAPIVAELGTCYNTTFVYYSIDNCVLPSGASSTLLTTTASSSASPTVSGTPSLTGASSSDTTSPAPGQSVVQHSSTPVGAIVGGVVGGVVALALIGAVLFYLLVIQKRRKSADEMGTDTTRHEAGRHSPQPVELDPMGLRAEADADSKVYYAKHAEGPYNSQVTQTDPPMHEMAGDEHWHGHQANTSQTQLHQGDAKSLKSPGTPSTPH